MGGRGTYASGNNVTYVYKTMDSIEGIKVLEPLDPQKSFSMPVEAHTSSGYITLDKAGTFRQYREYNAQHLPTFEIGYHFEKGLSTHGEPALHYHEYSAPGIEYRGKAKPITPALIKKYRKYFKGVTI